MKHTIKILVCFALGVLLSCSKSDDASPQPSLVGAWSKTTDALSNCSDPSLNQPATACTTTCYTFAFTATTVSYAGSTGSDPYTLVDNVLTIKSSSKGTLIYKVTITSTTLTLVANETLGCILTMVFKKV